MSDIKESDFYKKIMEDHQAATLQATIDYEQQRKIDGIEYAIDVIDQAQLVLNDIGLQCIPDELNQNWINARRVLSDLQERLSEYSSAIVSTTWILYAINTAMSAVENIADNDDYVKLTPKTRFILTSL